MNFRNYLLLLFIVVVFSSCSISEKITVEVSSKSLVPISDQIQSIVLMNRSMTSDFQKYSSDSLEDIFVKKNLKLNETFLDSTASDTSLIIAGNRLYESGRFDVVVPIKRNIYAPENQDGTPAPLTQKQVETICKEFDADALLLLESFTENVTSSFRKTFLNEGNQFGVGYAGTGYAGVIQVGFMSNWNLYQLNQQLVITSFVVKDTIFWETENETVQKSYDQLPTILEVLFEGAIANSEKFVKNITPQWNKETRYYFTTNYRPADEAIKMLEANKWNEAKEIWLKFSSISSRNLKSKIEYNIALACEMTGNYEEAIEWLNTSLKTKYSKTAEQYIKTLQKIKSNIKLNR